MKLKKYGKGLVFGLTALAALALGTRTARAAEISIQSGYSTKNITDNNLYTNLELKKGEKIVISDAKEVTQLYILWDAGTNGGNGTGNEYFYGARGLATWKLLVDGEEYDYGQKGFLQEYIKLPKQGEKLEIVLEGNASVVEVYAIEGEEVPDYVHIWDDPCEEADILLISAHSDDEVLFFGGTLPYYANELGLKVQLAYFTYHNQKIRAHEALNAIYYCGVRNYPVFGEFKDEYSTSLSQAQNQLKNWGVFNEAQKMIVELYRRFKPNCVLTHDPNGEYGHGMHMLVSNLAQNALTIAADGENYPDLTEKYGVWEVPKTYLHLYSENQIYMDWEFDLVSYGGENVWNVVGNAFRLYDSQMKYYGPLDANGNLKKNSSLYNLYNHCPSKYYDCRVFGLYRSLVGADVKKNDFLENIKPVQYKTYKLKYSKVRSITHKNR